MTGTYRLTAAYHLASNGTVVALVALAVVAGGVAGVAYATADSSHTVTQREHVQQFHLVANDSAVVENGTRLWPTGTQLADSPVYLTDASPTLTVTARTRVPDGTDVRVRQRVVLVLEASADGERFWSKRQTLASTSKTVADGRVVTRSEVDVSAVGDRIDRIRDDLPGAATLDARVRVVTQYDSGRYAGNLSTGAPLSLSGESYRVGAFDPASQTRAETVTRQRRAGFSAPTTSVLGGTVTLLALVGALAAAVGTRRVDDPERLRERLERERFAEWVSEGTVPDTGTDTTVTMASLTDLVDVAIDADRRVIHDAERDTYVVLDGDVVYTYDAHGSDGERASDDAGGVEPLFDDA